MSRHCRRERRLALIKYRPPTEALVQQRERREEEEEVAWVYPRDRSDGAVATAMTATGTSVGLHGDLHHDVRDGQERWRREGAESGAPERLHQHY